MDALGVVFAILVFIPLVILLWMTVILIISDIWKGEFK